MVHRSVLERASKTRPTPRDTAAWYSFLAFRSRSEGSPFHTKFVQAPFHGRITTSADSAHRRADFTHSRWIPLLHYEGCELGDRRTEMWVTAFSKWRRRASSVSRSLPTGRATMSAAPATV